MGKGDARRPSVVTRERYESEWDRIFGGQQQRGEGWDAIERDAVNHPPAEDAPAQVGEAQRE